MLTWSGFHLDSVGDRRLPVRPSLALDALGRADHPLWPLGEILPHLLVSQERRNQPPCQAPAP